MRSPLPSRTDVLRLLTAGLPPPGPFPLSSREPDPGLFGPQSVTWRMMREPLLILGASRALLMQVANPLVAQGALDHSNFAEDPIGRFQHTVAWVTSVVFGTTEEAVEATRQVNRLHHKVVGLLPQGHATGAWPAGTPYRAQDHDLILWVHGSLLHAMLDTHRALVRRLPDRDEDQFVREWDEVGRLMGLVGGSGWNSAAEMRDWIQAQVSGGQAQPGAGSRQVADVILVPRTVGSLPRWVAELTGFITAGLLPPETRRHFGLSWTPAHEAAHLGLRATLRAARPAMPRALRVSPVYDFAVARAAGELARRPQLVQQLTAEMRVV